MGGRRALLKTLGCAGVASLGFTGGCLEWVQNRAPKEFKQLTPPPAAFHLEYAINTELLTVLLIQGGEVPPAEVYIRGTGLAEVGSWKSLGGETSGAGGTIAEGDSLTVHATPDYVVRVVWEKYGVSQLYTEETGPEA